MLNDDSPFDINTHLIIPFCIVVGLCFVIMVSHSNHADDSSDLRNIFASSWDSWLRDVFEKDEESCVTVFRRARWRSLSRESLARMRFTTLVQYVWMIMRKAIDCGKRELPKFSWWFLMFYSTSGSCHVVTLITQNASTFGWQRTEEFVRFASGKFTQSGNAVGLEDVNRLTQPVIRCLLLTRTTQRLWSIRKTATLITEPSMKIMRAMTMSRWRQELNRMSCLTTRSLMVVSLRDSKDSTHLIEFLICRLSLLKNSVPMWS